MNVILDEPDALVHVVRTGDRWAGTTWCIKSYVTREPQNFDDRWIGNIVEAHATCLWCAVGRPKL